MSTSQLSCVDESTCAILGIDGSGSSRVEETTDEGATWSVLVGPTGVDPGYEIGGLSCSGASSCVTVMGDPAEDSPAYAYRTTDGGRNWSRTELPAGFVPGSLACTASGDCIATGYAASDQGGSGPPGEAAFTTGEGWSTSTLPPGTGALGPVSCGATDCLTSAPSADGSTSELLGSSDGGRTFTTLSASGLPESYVGAVSCYGSSGCTVAGVIASTSGSHGSGPADVGAGLIASTSDGGATFEAAELPRQIGPVVGVSCAGPDACYAAALTTGGSPHGSFVLLTNGG